MRREFGWLAACVIGCAAPPQPIAPALPPIPAPPVLWPTEPLAAPAPSALLEASPPTAPLAAFAAPSPSAAEAPLSVAPLPDADPGPIPTLLVESPYKMGERAEPRTQDAYRREVRELRHWGKGGTGELAEPLPGPEGHPDPRVIVNLERIQGPHPAAEVLRLARRNHWIQVVRCYRLGAYKDPNLRGSTKALVSLGRRGEVRSAKLLETDLADRAVADCMVEKMRGLSFPAARGTSTARFELRVGPGDEPMPPPEELLVPGDGFLSTSSMREGVRPAEPELEACYRQALGRAPGLWGRLVLRFHLTERGKVDEVFPIGTPFPDARMSQCVVRAARRLTFPKPEGGDLRFVVGFRFWSDRSQHQLSDSAAQSTP